MGMKNLPIYRGAEDEKLCKVVVDGSVAFGGGSQVSSITSEIFLSSVYRIAKKVSQGTSDTSTVIEDYTPRDRAVKTFSDLSSTNMAS